MKPVPKTRDELLAILDDMRAVVAADDSMEGSIEYLIPVPEQCGRCDGSGVFLGTPCQHCDGSGMYFDPDLKDAEFVVRASYRVGNSMGQGGVRLVGDTSTTG